MSYPSCPAPPARRYRPCPTPFSCPVPEVAPPARWHPPGANTGMRPQSSANCHLNLLSGMATQLVRSWRLLPWCGRRDAGWPGSTPLCHIGLVELRRPDRGSRASLPGNTFDRVRTRPRPCSLLELLHAAHSCSGIVPAKMASDGAVSLRQNSRATAADPDRTAHAAMSVRPAAKSSACVPPHPKPTSATPRPPDPP